MNDVVKEIDKTKTQLMAFLLSDASFHLHKLPDGQIRHRISMNTTDESLATLFQKLCEESFHKKLKVRESFPNFKWSRVLSVQTIVPVKTVRKLLHLCKTFRTKSINGKITKATIPREIREGKNEIKRIFLRIFASAEGSVHLVVDKQRKWWSINRWVSIRCCHPTIHQQIVSMLKTLGINAKSVETSIRIKGKENLVKFRSLIGFVDKCKVTKKSKFWQGIEKNKLLDLSIKLFDMNKEHIQRMEKNEIIKWLKSLLKGEMDSET